MATAFELGTVPEARAAAPAFVLTLSCPDVTGIVAAVSGFLASRHCLIKEAQHYNDPHTVMSFMRTVFHPTGDAPSSLPMLEQEFGDTVAKQFGMSYRFFDGSKKCPVLLAVSRQGHCLNSILHRWSTGTLPIEVVGVISNHQDMRGLAEWHGVPYYYLPVIGGRKVEQEGRIREVFERSGAELLVLARYMQILSPEACSYPPAGPSTSITRFFLDSRAPELTTRHSSVASSSSAQPPTTSPPILMRAPSSSRM